MPKHYMYEKVALAVVDPVSVQTVQLELPSFQYVHLQSHVASAAALLLFDMFCV